MKPALIWFARGRLVPLMLCRSSGRSKLAWEIMGINNNFWEFRGSVASKATPKPTYWVKM